MTSLSACKDDCCLSSFAVLDVSMPSGANSVECSAKSSPPTAAKNTQPASAAAPGQSSAPNDEGKKKKPEKKGMRWMAPVV